MGASGGYCSGCDCLCAWAYGSNIAVVSKSELRYLSDIHGLLFRIKPFIERSNLYSDSGCQSGRVFWWRTNLHCDERKWALHDLFAKSNL
jgi:hypothetical protein